MGFRDKIKDRSKLAFWGDGSPDIPKKKKPKKRTIKSPLEAGAYIDPKHSPQPTRSMGRLHTEADIRQCVIDEHIQVMDATVSSKYKDPSIPTVTEIKIIVDDSMIQTHKNSDPFLLSLGQLIATIQHKLERRIPVGVQIEIVGEVKTYTNKKPTCTGCKHLGANNTEHTCTHAKVYPRTIAEKPHTPYKPTWCPIGIKHKPTIGNIDKQCMVCGSFNIRPDRQRIHLYNCEDCGNQWTPMNFPR